MKHFGSVAVVIALTACSGGAAGSSITPPSHNEASRTSASYAVAYSFVGPRNDGWVPARGLVSNNGLLYGLTGYGGRAHKGECGHGCGAFYAFDPSSNQNTILYSFHGSPDAALPNSQLVYYNGAFYAAAWTGGTSNFGAIFKLEQHGDRWKESILYSFKGPPNDGTEPTEVHFDGYGRIFGTTFFGGNETTCFFKSEGCGTVFELTPPTSGSTRWHESVLYNFPGAPDGAAPGALAIATDGTLYGDTQYGGTSTACPYLGGCGTIYRLKPDSGSRWSESVLHSFNVPGGEPQNDGSIPGNFFLSPSGSMYGTTAYGGAYGSNVCNVEKGLTACGTVFVFARKGKRWTESILYGFKGGQNDGAQPDNVTPDGNGGFYGETASGGAGLCDGYLGCGTLFHLTRARKGGWKEKVLHSFAGAATDGFSPGGDLISYGTARYGTTGYGGSGPCSFGCGTIYAFTP